ncbi:MAG: serine/threonine-protein kinase [Verrucomicrobiota bacterium]
MPPSPPSDSQLRALLDGALPPDEEQHLADLVAASPELEARLAQLSGATEFDRDFSPGPDPTNPANPTLSTTSSPSKAPQTALLSLLQPSDDPHSKGRLDNYEVEEVIATGGMAIVYKARDTELNRTVAIKLLSPVLAGNPDARERFLREAKSAAALDHPNIVPIFNVEPNHEPPYLVMRYIDGQSLQDHLDEKPSQPLPLDEVLIIAQSIASALNHAHGENCAEGASGSSVTLVHRDIKPSNILLEHPPNPPAATRASSIEHLVSSIYLTDFGLARPADQSASLALTQTGHFIGTPQYMSPEQAAGKNHSLDHRSDLFSFGAVLYTIATGQAPFQGDSFSALAHEITETAPTPPRQLNPKLPSWLANLITRLLAKRPADRPQSAAEILDIINQKTNLGTLALSRLVGQRTRLKKRLTKVALATLTVALTITATALVADLLDKTAPFNNALATLTGRPFYIAGDLAVYPDLQSAANNAQPNDHIVLHRNGIIPLSQPVTLPDNTPLTLRAPTSTLPILKVIYDGAKPAITTTSPLTLENLAIGGDPQKIPPPIIQITKADLSIANCLIVRNIGATVPDRHPTNMATGLIRCIECPSLTVTDSSLIGFDIAAFQFKSSAAPEPDTITFSNVFSYGAHALSLFGPPSSNVLISIENSSLSGARPFAFPSPGSTPSLTINSNHTRFGNVRLFSAPNWTPDQIKKHLSWSGQYNHYAVLHGFFSRIRNPLNDTSDVDRLFENWRQFTGSPETNSTMTTKIIGIGPKFVASARALDPEALRAALANERLDHYQFLDLPHLGPR